MYILGSFTGLLQGVDVRLCLHGHFVFLLLLLFSIANIIDALLDCCICYCFGIDLKFEEGFFMLSLDVHPGELFQFFSPFRLLCITVKLWPIFVECVTK